MTPSNTVITVEKLLNAFKKELTMPIFPVSAFCFSFFIFRTPFTLKTILTSKYSNIPSAKIVLRNAACGADFQVVIDFKCIIWIKHRISSGPLEGLNNKVKTMKRMAYGYRDMNFFILRLLFIHESTYAITG